MASPGRSPSPHFALPDLFPPDDEANASPPHQLPLMTIECASCERTIGDSTSFLCAIRQSGLLVLTKLISVTFGKVTTDALNNPNDIPSSPLQDPEQYTPSIPFDYHCLYRPIHCGRCSEVLGKHYISVSDNLDDLRKKFAVYRTKIQVYYLGSELPSLRPGESEEIMRQLHPEPDEVAGTIDRLMGLVVYLKEEQDLLREGLERLRAGKNEEGLGRGDGEVVGDRREEDDGWREKMESRVTKIEESFAVLPSTVTAKTKRLTPPPPPRLTPPHPPPPPPIDAPAKKLVVTAIAPPTTPPKPSRNASSTLHHHPPLPRRSNKRTLETLMITASSDTEDPRSKGHEIVNSFDGHTSEDPDEASGYDDKEDDYKPDEAGSEIDQSPAPPKKRKTRETVGVVNHIPGPRSSRWKNYAAVELPKSSAVQANDKEKERKENKAIPRTRARTSGARGGTATQGAKSLRKSIS